MSTQRHYTEKEIAAIFERATRAQEASKHANPHEKGLTLAELQAIGAASGITPEFIAHAAASIDHTARVAPPVRRLGMTVGVGRTVDLPGKLSDEAWEQLVVDIRETFQAKGKLQREGSLRHWTNGNLQVLVEPTQEGERLRMKTRNQNLEALFTMGSIGGVMMLILAAAVFMKGDMEGVMVMLAPLVLFLGMLGYSGFNLPGWARTREEQMEALGARAVELTAASAPSSSKATATTTSRTPDAEPDTAPPRVNLDLLPDEPAEPTQPTHNRVRG